MSARTASRARNKNKKGAAKSAETKRLALLDAASEMLAHGGPEAISLRKLAEQVGTSTMAVYTLFGGKDGLIQALYQEAFRRLGDRQEAVPRDADPLVWLRSLAAAYRRFALDSPNYYSLMVSGAMPLTAAKQASDTPPPARMIAQERAYRCLHESITACIEAGYFAKDADPRGIADALWAMVHGLMSLELAGYHRSRKIADERFVSGAGAVVRGFLTPNGAAAMDRAESSARH